jgi:hypothetical protein
MPLPPRSWPLYGSSGSRVNRSGCDPPAAGVFEEHRERVRAECLPLASGSRRPHLGSQLRFRQLARRRRVRSSNERGERVGPTPRCRLLLIGWTVWAFHDRPECCRVGGREAGTVYSPSMTGNRPDSPGECRTHPAIKTVVTQGKTSNAGIAASGLLGNPLGAGFERRGHTSATPEYLPRPRRAQ